MTIPDDMRTMGVMLASPGKNPDTLLAQMLTERDRWVWEWKVDGVRVLVYTENGRAWLRNRQGVNITAQYPEIIAHLENAYPTESMVFDAEMLCFDPATGSPTFNRMQRRNAQSNPKAIATLSVSMPATIMAFDLLLDRGTDLRRVMQQGRRMLLEKAAEHFDNERIMLCPASDDGAMMWEQVHTLKLEGLIAKRKSGMYIARRDPGWVKLKKISSLSVVAIAYDFGKGSRSNTIGAVTMGVLQDGTTISVGRVGTGFTEHDLTEVKRRMDDGQLVVMEVQYQNWMRKSSKLRHPSFCGIRFDVEPIDCTYDQLDEALGI